MKPQEVKHDLHTTIEPSGSVSFYTQFNYVQQFHKFFNRTAKKLTEHLTEEEIELRHSLIDEEVNKELLPALEKLKKAPTLENYAEVLDACVDSCYVIMGTCVAAGLPFDAAFEMVHLSNMTKVGADGKPIIREDGKILKPEGWKPAPVHELVLFLFKSLTIQDSHQKALPTPALKQ